ncbi:Z-DNA-binding protein 1/Z-DNA complex-binding [Bacteriophage sp.]|nr:Z-DNA-binding protein 1/Z-DNA complex-binding [Caudoviricetes sp.]UOF80002.1 Z-DNA-binding protein 1/Z-DNA complex-binding [Bacteriophage sp.]
MSKKDDIDDLLGDTKPAKKTAAKKEAAAPAKEVKEAKAPAAKKAAKEEPKAEAKPAPAKKAATKEADAEPKEKAKKEPIRFEEGERQTIADAVTAHFKRSKKPINSRELAEKIGTETRKLRVVLYSLVKKEVVQLEPGESKVSGMTVSPA